MPAKISIDPKELEELAASGLTITKAAASLRLKDVTLYYKLGKEPELKTAWQRGMARSLNSEGASPAQAEPPMTSVLRLLREGAKCRRELKEATGLDYTQINLVLYELEHEQRIITRTEDRAGIEYFRMIGDESTSFARTESHVHIVEEMIASDERISADLDDVVAASADDGTVKPEEEPERETAMTPVAPPPAIAMPQTQSSVLEPVVYAIEAARIEMLYQSFWQEPSPQHKRVAEALDQAAQALKA